MAQMTTSERADIKKLIDDRYLAGMRELAVTDESHERRLEERCRKVAVGRLKIAKELAEVERLEAEYASIGEKLEVAREKLNKKLPYEKRHHSRSCPSRMDLCSAIAAVVDEVREAERAKDATGRKVLQLRAEKQRRYEKLAGCRTQEDVAAARIFD